MDVLTQGTCVAWRIPVARESFSRDRVALPRHFTRCHFLKLSKRILIGLTSSPYRLEHGKVENLAIRSQRLDSDGVGAMITNRDEKNHLSEFSDALQTVAKALEDVAVKKALAQDEAAQWKHKYELELLRNAQLERSIASRALDSSREDKPSAASVISEGEIDATEFRSSPQNTKTRSNGYLQYKENIPNPKVLSYSPDPFNTLYLDTQLDSNISEKASFTLTWDPVDERRKEQNHDLVSFDDGDINAEVRSNKQITLVWNSSPASVFILLKPNAAAVQQLCKEMVWWLKEQNVPKIYVEPRVKAELMEENADFEFIQTCETEKQLVTINKSVDLVITLGGDGTMLWKLVNAVLGLRGGSPCDKCKG